MGAAFLYKGDLVVEESEESVLAGIGTGEDIPADEPCLFCRAGAEICNVFHGDTADPFHIGRLLGFWPCNCDDTAHVISAGVEEFAYGGKHQRRYGPDGITFHDRRYMMYLYADISCRMLPAESVEYSIFNLVERSPAGVDCIQGYVHPAVSESGEDIHSCLDVLELVPEHIFRIRSQRCSRECGYEDSLRLYGRIGDNAVRSLDKGRPKAALHEQGLYLVSVKGVDLTDIEFQIFLFGVSLDAYLKQLPLFPPDNLCHRTAYRRCEKNVWSFLVSQNRRACEHLVTFPDKQSRFQTAEISRLDGDNVRHYHLSGLLGCNSRNRDIQTFFQINVVGHYKNRFEYFHENRREYSEFFRIFAAIMENIADTVLEGLNEVQRQAVCCVDGPVLIVAGAGSGKTRVLTSRIAYILAQGCDPSAILALTFTKKAANEMKERIAAMVGEKKARRLYMGTFHSVFIRFLREYAGSLGYPQSFTIYDTSDSISAIKACIKELQLDDKVYKPKDVLSRISMAKNNLYTAEAYARKPEIVQNDAARKKPRICDIYRLYAQKCRQSGVMDFDDILLNMNILLRDNPEALESVAGRFSYIMVDEYQDTNYSQYVILKKLSAVHRNICVVGDDSQSIYGFRGAKIENILNFRSDYPDNRIFRLEQNYRSTRTIVDAANSLIAKNTARIPKKCFSESETGEKIRLINAYTEQEEALLIASSILSRIQSAHAQYQDFAVLYRTNSQSRALEEALRRRNLPYVIYSGNSFYDRAEVKDMMAYLKLVANPNDEESFKRVLNKPARGIGATSMAALAAAASDRGISLYAAGLSDGLETYGLKPAAISRIRSFCQMISLLNARAAREDAHDIAVSAAVDSGLLADLKSDNSIEGQSRTSNVEELLNSVSAFVEERKSEYMEKMQADSAADEVAGPAVSDLPAVTINEYLENVSLLSAVDMSDDEDSANRITLMTVHSSKGLEFPYVYVAGMEENLFPSGGMLASESDIEEERRLFYVAVTRARKAVCLSFASTRMRNGKSESNAPSRFVREIDSRYILNPLGGASDGPDRMESSRRWQGRPSEPSPSHSGGEDISAGRKSGVTPFRKPAAAVPKRVADADFEPTPILQLRAGQRIEHNRFGFGRIESISGGPSDELKAVIAFDDYGEKILLLKYARIRAVDK